MSGLSFIRETPNREIVVTASRNPATPFQRRTQSAPQAPGAFVSASGLWHYKWLLTYLLLLLLPRDLHKIGGVRGFETDLFHARFSLDVGGANFAGCR